MANKKQLALLEAGVEGWNKWREKEPDEKIDLNEAYLLGANLSDANFSEAEFFSILCGIRHETASMEMRNYVSYSRRG